MEGLPVRYVRRASVVLLFLLGTFICANDTIANVDVSLVTPARGVQSGEAISVGVHFKIAPGWHVYAEDPGEVGFPTKVLLTFPEGGYADDLKWTPPHEIEVYGKKSFIYENEFWVWTTVTPPLTLGSTFSVVADLSWGECKDVCIPEMAHLVLTLPVSEEQENAVLAKTFKELQQGTMDSFAWVLLLAFVGGLILNIMPCVLPVISLKVLSLLEHGGKKVFLHNIIFSLGILLTFWLLAGMLMLFQYYGHDLGWGFQFQEPLFVGFLAALLLVLSLNLFGVFEMGISLGGVGLRRGYWGSFLNGLLATVVSTPCTGPFLGTVIGLSAVLTPMKTFCVFTLMGLGLASPYLILGMFPQGLRYLPKPGRWMMTFKQVMGFLLLATVMWLIWVYQSQVVSMSLLILLLAFVGIGIACWVYGCWGARWIALLLLVASCAIFALNTTSEEGDDWISYSEDRLEAFRSEGKPVFLEFTAKWCLICQTNIPVLTSSTVEAFFKQYGIIKMRADWTRKDPEITRALEKYGRRGVPLYIFFKSDGSYQILPQLLTPQMIEDIQNVH